MKIPSSIAPRPWASGARGSFTAWVGVRGARCLEAAGDAAEVLRDMTEITHVDVDPDDAVESNEAAYAELVEFVRVGVQLLYDQLQPLRDPPRTRAPGSAALKAPSGICGNRGARGSKATTRNSRAAAGSWCG